MANLMAITTYSRKRADAMTLPPPTAIPTGCKTPGQRWRFRRDLVIYLAHRRNGLSQRLLAEVFDLPRSRIAEIIKNFERHDPGAERETRGESTRLDDRDEV